MIMAGKRGRQSRGVRVELVAGSRRAKDDGPVDEDIRSALGNWPMEKENRWHKGNGFWTRMMRKRSVKSRRRSSDWRDERRC